MPIFHIFFLKLDFPKQKKIILDNRDDKQKEKRRKKGDRLLFPEERGLSLGPGLVIENRNSSVFSYLSIPMIGPDLDDIEKVACPFFLLFNMLIIKT